ncbi:hypothetical protein PANO66_02536 [Planktothrix agardhii]|jgi:hypothetical protein|uniref:Uncharacterized protein n=1 Tax=Planktothrix agardhii TaxID=1160 RepID=A0AAD1Q3P2_PLAAG|nr:hypothetical protein PANO66_02536 [Planktothrix agardhii]CAD5954270.1 hypothetical protein NO2A_03221 [Planktothrix agardhii]
MNITDIRNQVKQYVDQLSPEKLMVAVDYVPLYLTLNC